MTENLSRFTETKQAVSLKAYAEEHLEHRAGGLVCPVCKSGAKANGTPALSITPDGEHWQCFSCNSNGDVFDMAGAVLGTDNRNEQLNAVRAWAGMPIASRGDRETFARATTPRPLAKPKQPEPDYDQGREDSRAYIETCRLNMRPNEADGRPCDGFLYLTGRGFTLEEIAEYGFGWDAERGRVVIPWSTKRGEWYHIDRDVTGAAPHKYTKPPCVECAPRCTCTHPLRQSTSPQSRPAASDGRRPRTAAQRTTASHGWPTAALSTDASSRASIDSRL